jgi:DNA-binding beta-propeller fold protein YncE
MWKKIGLLFLVISFLLFSGVTWAFFARPSFVSEQPAPKPKVKRYLYVATPGIRNYLEYGGHGLLVYDIDNNYRLVKRIPTAGLNEKGLPINVKGIGVSLATNCIYISTLTSLQCLDLRTEKLLWEKEYEGGCDRMAIAPDGKTIYLPSLEKDHWHVVDAKTGVVQKKIVTNSGAHNTIYGLNGNQAYLAGLRSPYLAVADTRRHEVVRQVGPFSNSIRPFTINGKQTLCFVNVNELLGFEIGDMVTGQRLYRVEVADFKTGPVKRHGCPSHGIGLTPDEKELWLIDAFNQRLHVFDATVMPPRQQHSIAVRDQPGWITFSLDGRHAYPSTGEIIDVSTHQVVGALQDENGQPVQSEKMIEIHLKDQKAVRAGDQFGLGRVVQ